MINTLICYGKKITYIIFAASLFIGAVTAQTFPNFTGPGFTITDGGGRVATSCSIVPVSGITTGVSVQSVSLNNMTHTWIGDLEARVYPPAATLPPSTTGSFTLFSPPDARPCNFNGGTYRFIDTATQNIDTASNGCGTNTNIAGGDYRTSTYGGGTNNGANTLLSASLGLFTPATANGNWRVCVFDFTAPDGGAVGGTSITFVAPTAAGLEVSGRVTLPDGRGLADSVVSMTDSSGAVLTSRTNSFGYFSFADVPGGQTYVFAASSRRYQFAPQAVFVSEDITNLNLSALSQ